MPPSRTVPSLDRAAAYSWRLLVVAAAVALAVAALIQLRVVLIPVVAAAFLATLLAPPVRWLERHRVPPLPATWMVLLVGLAILVGLGALLAPPVAEELDDLGGQLREAGVRLDRLLTETVGVPDRWIDRVVGGIAEEVRGGGIAARALRGARLAVEAVVAVLLTLVVLFFFLKDGPRMATWVGERLPPDRRRVVEAAAGRSWSLMGAYLRGVAITGVVNAVVIGVVLAILGVPLVLPLVVLTFLGAFFPLVGAVAAGVVAVAVALVSEGVTTALIVAAAVVAVQQLEGDVVAPVVLRRAVRLHPLVIVLVLAAGAVVAGIAGAFLAVPLTAIVVGVTGEVRAHRLDAARGQGRPPGEPSAERPL